MDDLIDVIGGDIEPQHREGWAVVDYGSANWAGTKVMEAAARIAAINATAEEYHRRIDAWVARAKKADEDSIAYFQEALRPWAEKELAGQKRRSLKLLDATVGFRALPSHLSITDETAAIAWAKAHAPDAVVVKETVSKTALKEIIESTGEVPEGCELVEGNDVFYVKPEGGKT